MDGQERTDMLMDLRSKLELYKSSQVVKNMISCQSDNLDMKIQHSGLEIQDLMDGRICTNSLGSFFSLEKSFELTYVHGGSPLGEVLKLPSGVLQQLCSAMSGMSGKTGMADIRDFIFMDTETTGLSGGAGTVAFLVGTGCFEKEHFVLRQYFMRDYDEEPAMLEELNGILRGRKGLVTFNGKSFDWNLLQTRFTFNRLRPSMREPMHLDLLYPSRRIWKLKLESCRLSALEEQVLGQFRHDDIPGSQIPAVYFKYLDTRDATEIKRVMDHNESDILSMLALLVKMGKMLSDPLANTDGGWELAGLGGIFEAQDKYEAVKKCYETCMGSENRAVRESVGKRLGTLYKRNGEYGKAVGLWSGQIGEVKPSAVHAAIELAKYYEHREKDISRALEIVDGAMSCCLKLGPAGRPYLDDLRIRQERLHRKARKSAGENNA